MSDSTGETESSAGASADSEGFDQGDSGIAFGASAETDGVRDTIPAASTDAPPAADPPPDITDVVGATTGPLRRPDAASTMASTDGSSPPADATGPPPGDGAGPLADATTLPQPDGATPPPPAEGADPPDGATLPQPADGADPPDGATLLQPADAPPPADGAAPPDAVAPPADGAGPAGDSAAAGAPGNGAVGATSAAGGPEATRTGFGGAGTTKAGTTDAGTETGPLATTDDGSSTEQVGQWAAPSADAVKEPVADDASTTATTLTDFVDQPPPPAAADAIPAPTGQITAEELARAEAEFLSSEAGDDGAARPDDVQRPEDATAARPSTDSPTEIGRPVAPEEAADETTTAAAADHDQAAGGETTASDGTDGGAAADTVAGSVAAPAESDTDGNEMTTADGGTGAAATTGPAGPATVVADGLDDAASPAEDELRVPPPPPPGSGAGPGAGETIVVDALLPPGPPKPLEAAAAQSPPPPPAADGGDPTIIIPAADVTGEVDESAPPTQSVAMMNAAAAAPSPTAEMAVIPTDDPGAAGPIADVNDQPEQKPKPKPKPKKETHRLRTAGLVLVGLVAVFLGAWLVDTIRTSGQVVRNTTLGTTPIGGLDRDDLNEVIDGIDADLADRPLTVTVGDQTIETDPASLGARVDRDAVIDAALDNGRGGGLLARPFQWVDSFSAEHQIEPTFIVATERAEEAVATILDDDLDDPVEPTMALRGSELVVDPGADGVTVDATQIAALLPDQLEDASAALAIELDPVAVPPELTDAAVQAVVDDASEATANPVIFRVLDQTSEVAVADVRSWVRLDATGEVPEWEIDGNAAGEHLKPLFPALGSEDQQARFSVVDGEPIIIPASETVICCDDASIGEIQERLLEPLPPPPSNDEDSDEVTDESGEETTPALRVITLEPEVVGSDEGVAELEALGVVEEVSTFTTNHACCQNRVTNIQRFADLMTGVIIRPGEDFSLNDHVGRRTVANGFAADGAIINGILEPQVGGGISQFATTFFNASFFAGLDFNEYQSHSLYISRYPRGREATISFPRPDLSVKNTTPYGILVWPTYTPTSITVTFYSTRNVEVEALDLLRSSNGACTRYTTPRVRTYPDGTTVEDSVFAVYRPGEGLDCNGNSTRPEDNEPAGPTTPEPDPADPAPQPDPQPDPEPDPEPSDPGPDPTPDPGDDQGAGGDDATP